MPRAIHNKNLFGLPFISRTRCKDPHAKIISAAAAASPLAVEFFDSSATAQQMSETTRGVNTKTERPRRVVTIELCFASSARSTANPSTSAGIVILLVGSTLSTTSQPWRSYKARISANPIRTSGHPAFRRIRSLSVNSKDKSRFTFSIPWRYETKFAPTIEAATIRPASHASAVFI